MESRGIPDPEAGNIRAIAMLSICGYFDPVLDWPDVRVTRLPAGIVQLGEYAMP